MPNAQISQSTQKVLTCFEVLVKILGVKIIIVNPQGEMANEISDEELKAGLHTEILKSTVYSAFSDEEADILHEYEGPKGKKVVRKVLCSASSGYSSTESLAQWFYRSTST